MLWVPSVRSGLSQLAASRLKSTRNENWNQKFSRIELTIEVQAPFLFIEDQAPEGEVKRCKRHIAR